MATPTLLRISIAVIFFFFSANFTAGISVSDHRLSWVTGRSSACQGSIGECFSGYEFAMDSEINRRILATSNYIGYNALKANNVPCSIPGASYYNCQPGAEANPGNRGCSVITRCRTS